MCVSLLNDSWSLKLAEPLIDESCWKGHLESSSALILHLSFSAVRLSFLSLQVLSCHIPFLVSSVEDFKDHIPRETDMKVGAADTLVEVDKLPDVMWMFCVFPGGHERVRAVLGGGFAL